MKVFSGSANRELAQRICDYIGVPLGKANISSFPDGETYVKIEENIRGRDVFIIQPTSPPTNEHLMELLIMVDAARRASADRITAVIPFFGYARQDRKDQPRVPITAKLVANLLVASGVHRVLTMDLHAQQVQGFFDIPVDHLYSMPVLIKYLRQQLTRKTVVVSPDVGGLKMASAYAQALGASLVFRPQGAFDLTVSTNWSKSLEDAFYVTQGVDATATPTYGSRYIFSVLHQIAPTGERRWRRCSQQAMCLAGKTS